MRINIGITLIEVPYWWDKQVSSLASTIYNTRPDLFDTKPQGIAIPSIPPSLTKDKTTSNKNSFSLCFF